MSRGIPDGYAATWPPVSCDWSGTPIIVPDLIRNRRAAVVDAAIAFYEALAAERGPFALLDASYPHDGSRRAKALWLRRRGMRVRAVTVDLFPSVASPKPVRHIT